MTTDVRTPLSRERVLRAAVALADQDGIDGLSMRKLAQSLGVEAMSLYNHVRNKDELLDSIVDVIVDEIEVVSPTADWKATLRQQVLAARAVSLRHRWAPRVIESRRTMSPALLRYMESVIGICRRGGFSVDLTHHTMHVLGSRVLGFTQDLFDDTSRLDAGPETAALMAGMLAQFPYIAELAMAVSHQGGLGGCDDDVEFAFGLDLILDGLEQLRAPRKPRRRPRAEPLPEADVDPSVVQAIHSLRANDQHVLRQVRSTFVELLDSVIADPPRSRAREDTESTPIGR